MAERKAKLLKKYMGQVKVKRQTFGREGLQVKDREQIQLNSSLSSQQEQSEDVSKRRRVEDSDEEMQESKAKKKTFEESNKKSKTVSKGIRKALGLKKGDDIDEFISALKIQGIDMKVIQSYLKQNKEGLIFQNKKQKKQKKLKKKKDKEPESQVKKQHIEENQSSSQSDVQIPEQARTIYRDKQGKIKQFSKAKQKELKAAQIMNRLSQWQKGMKNQQIEQQSQNDNLWDDPAKRWQSSATKHPLTCAYQGYANRFNIKPGYRWDGVIRGNGFETTYLQQINLKKAEENRQHLQYMKNL